MDHSCETGCHACGSTGADLRAPARKGLFWASILCIAAALAAAQLASHATDDLHRVMFGVLSGALGVAAFVLQVVRIGLGLSARSP
jgi:cytochrome b561